MPVGRIFRIMMALLIGTLLQMSPVAVGAPMPGTMVHMKENAHRISHVHAFVGKAVAKGHPISITCLEHDPQRRIYHARHVKVMSSVGGKPMVFAPEKIVNADNIEGSCCQTHYNMHGMLGVLVEGDDELLPEAKEAFSFNNGLLLVSSYKAAPWRPPAKRIV